MAQIIRIKFVILLLMKLTIPNIIHAEDTLRFVLVEENGARIVLNWEKTEQLLINKHTPLWLAVHGTDGKPNLEYRPNFISNAINDFVMYRDVTKSSAVVYFPRFRSLRGNIGLKYKIEGLPLTELQHEHNAVGSRYVKKYENVPLLHEYQSIEQHFDNNQVTVLYPEVLIIITNDLFASLKEINPYHGLLLVAIQQILYFNSISMMFDKLSTEQVKVHINIAGIIVENAPGVIPLSLSPEDISDEINTEEALLFAIPKFLRESQFSDDSFDFFFVSTEYPLGRTVAQNGYSTPRFPMYEMRATKRTPDIPRYLGSIVEYKDGYASCISAAHRIAWLMNINAQSLPKHIEWTEKNGEELGEYARGNRNRCFLLNFPRSLRPFGLPYQTISPSNQCICYGYDPVMTVFHSVGHSGCHERLMCKHKPIRGRHQSHDSSPKKTPIPIDGTPCDTNKVCWQGHCRPL